MSRDDDPRSLRQVVADSDLRLANAIASTTGVDPQHWLELMEAGTPFREIQQLAQEIVRKRIKAFTERKAKRRAG